MAISMWNATKDKDPEIKNGYLFFCPFLDNWLKPLDSFNSVSWTEYRFCEVYKQHAIK